MHSATLSGLSVAATATTRSLGSTFPSSVALNAIYFPLLSAPDKSHLSPIARSSSLLSCLDHHALSLVRCRSTRTPAGFRWQCFLVLPWWTMPRRFTAVSSSSLRFHTMGPCRPHG